MLLPLPRRGLAGRTWGCSGGGPRTNRRRRTSPPSKSSLSPPEGQSKSHASSESSTSWQCGIPSTGLHNRRYFHETLAHELKRTHRYDRRLALIFLDLDDFKSINEEIGHLGGDAVLAEVAQRLRSVVRGADIPCRVGGDEFAFILPESSLEDAERFFQPHAARIEGQPIGRIANVQISAGMAELGRDDDATSLFRRVDQALYRAKRAGKGRVVAADDSEESSEATSKPARARERGAAGRRANAAQ